MNEDQADQIIDLLKEITDRLSSIESNTMDISSVDSNTSEALDCLRKIKNNLR